MSKHKGLVLVVALVAAMSCGGAGGTGGYGGGPTSPPPPGNSNPNAVTLNASSFSPTALTVALGSTVTWEWAPCTGGDGYGGACPTHSITFDDGSDISSGVLSAGQFRRTFSAAGTYKYHCAVHGAALMSGEIRVQ